MHADFGVPEDKDHSNKKKEVKDSQYKLVYPLVKYKDE
jgi:hypothetical protein